MDKGYDFPDIRELVKEYGYTAHIKSRGEENIRKEIPGFRARRWVVERTHFWPNRSQKFRNAPWSVTTTLKMRLSF